MSVMAHHRMGRTGADASNPDGATRRLAPTFAPEQRHYDREVHAFQWASHRGRPGNRTLILLHGKHSDENNRARQIAEQVSGVSPQASLRHLSAGAGAGREWLMTAEPDSVGYLPGGPLAAQNDPKRAYVLEGRRWPVLRYNGRAHCTPAGS